MTALREQVEIKFFVIQSTAEKNGREIVIYRAKSRGWSAGGLSRDDAITNLMADIADKKTRPFDQINFFLSQD